MTTRSNSFTLTKHSLALSNQSIFYRHYQNPDLPKRHLLLLHGAGVSGDLTWQFIINYLQHWSDIFVPDLRGMGQTTYPDHIERHFEYRDVLDDLQQLLHQLNIQQFDIGGYSFGGLIAMLLKQQSPKCIEKEFLFESALLFGLTQEELIHARDQYHEVVTLILKQNEIEKAIHLFIDLITPKHLISERNRTLIANRLLHRPIGFAYAIDCVNQSVYNVSRSELLKVQQNVSSFVGENSRQPLHDIHEFLANTNDDWQHHKLEGADHALVFQKPRQIAKLMNQDMAVFLSKP